MVWSCHGINYDATALETSLKFSAGLDYFVPRLHSAYALARNRTSIRLHMLRESDGHIWRAPPAHLST
jgi:hypothetical protein